MALITRISRLFTADLHAVLDRIEEPDVLLRQAIREMEEELAKDEQRARWLTREQEALAARALSTEQGLAQLEEELDVCFASGKQDLAKNLIRRRLERQRQARATAAKRDSNSKALVELHATLEERRAALESMRQKAEMLAETVPAESAGGEPLWTSREFAVSDEEVEVAFLREQQRRQPS